MKMIHILQLYLFLVTINCQSTGETREIRLGNKLYIKTFTCNNSGPGKILVNYTGKNDYKQLAVEGSPFFEMILNGIVTTSNDPLWTFRRIRERAMTNGGTEYILEFEGGTAHVNGLRLSIVQQVFPGSTLMREKLIFHSNESSFTLNKNKGKLHFIFPRYQMKLNSRELHESVEIRIASWENKAITFGDRKSGNHMYYPDFRIRPVPSEPGFLKGPVHILTGESFSWITTYEHASQDNTSGMLDEALTGEGNLINDAMQGTKGMFRFPLKDEDFYFLGINPRTSGNRLIVSVEALRGAYLDGEIIDPEHPYETVWCATGFTKGNSLETGLQMIRAYLFTQISEKLTSRRPEFYYNTWGMQRTDPSRPLRGILTYDRIFEEIDYAAQLGVDIFVLDDGWEQAQGIWIPHRTRLPEGLDPVKEKLDQYGMKLGLWLSPMGIDSTAARYREHPNWVIIDSEGNPVQAQWGHPAFDFVSGFYDLFIEDCKSLIDQGCRFMKWDAINTFYSALPGLDHGSKEYSAEELRARYEYLLPLYVIRAMNELTAYEPELTVEIDLTEARRAMPGLAAISAGKLFFMNNGASAYNDYSRYRAMSMRTIVNEFAGLIPFELFTYANYPHNLEGCMEYNVHNSLLAGHGFWGDLSLMNNEQREYVGRLVTLSKRVLPYLTFANPIVTGKVGASPEIYSIFNGEKPAGEVISFSSDVSKYSFEQELNSRGLLAVINNPYNLAEDLLRMELEFSEEGASSAIFILPNDDTDITILSSSVSISDARIRDNQLTYCVNVVGKQQIRWPNLLGEPVVDCNVPVLLEQKHKGDWIYLDVTLQLNQETTICVKSSNE